MMVHMSITISIMYNILLLRRKEGDWVYVGFLIYHREAAYTSRLHDDNDTSPPKKIYQFFITKDK